MKRFLPLMLLLVLAALLVGCTAQECNDKVIAMAPPPPAEGIPADHPDLDEQEMYIACSDCHREETPEIVDQWYNSGHGIGTVKCYQCHGTYEDMMRVPAQSNCMACHEDQMKNQGDNLSCWQCHPAHSFTGHNSERGEG